jgi:PAS domain S-box-containing protein
VPVELTAGAVRNNDGNLVGIRWLLRDITRRKQVENELRLKDLAISSSINAIVIADLEGKITYVNDSFLQMWGYENSEQVRGRSAVELFRDPDQISRVMKTLVNQEVWRGELVAVREDGSTFEVEDSASLVRDSQGNPLQVMGSFIDITKRVQAERRLKRRYEREKYLHEKVETELKKRIEFARALSHELRTPLTPVMMSSDVLVNVLKDEEHLKLAKNVHRSTINLKNRIDELIDLAKSDIGQLQVHPGKVDVIKLIREMDDEFAAASGKHGQYLKMELPDELPWAIADESRLRQILMNLLNNAFKFTPTEGVVTLAARRKDATLEIEVRDTGPGIDRNDIERLFDPYFRVDGDTERFSGLGLGLALCKTFVELQGGRIWVNSHPGLGSTFTFSLPIAAPDRAALSTEI